MREDIQPRSSRRGLAGDQRGALILEYAVVTMVGLIVATALVGLGVAMVNNAIGPTLQVLYSEYP